MLLNQADGLSSPTRTYATFGPRFAAAIIDWLIQLGLGLGSSMGAGLIIRTFMALGVLHLPADDHKMEQTWQDLVFGPRMAVIVAFLVSTGILYRPLCESSGLQATLGKRLMGVIVTDQAGARLTLPRAIGRSILRGIAFFLPLLPASAVCVLVREDKKGPHDLIAGTMNLRGKAPGELGLSRIVAVTVLPIVWVAVTMIAVVF